MQCLEAGYRPVRDGEKLDNAQLLFDQWVVPLCGCNSLNEVAKEVMRFSQEIEKMEKTVTEFFSLKEPLAELISENRRLKRKLSSYE